jgi:hypothetical protein
MDELLETLCSAERFPFSEWPNPAVPIGAGVYTIWEGPRFIYVGMSGLAKNAEQIAQAKLAGKKKMLRERLGSHASGRRSGDQFCVYVSDRLVIASLSADDIAKIASGEVSGDSHVKDYIHKNLMYRFLETRDGAIAVALEDLIRSGETVLGSPLINPKRSS